MQQFAGIVGSLLDQLEDVTGRRIGSLPDQLEQTGRQAGRQTVCSSRVPTTGRESLLCQ